MSRRRPGRPDANAQRERDRSRRVPSVDPVRPAALPGGRAAAGGDDLDRRTERLASSSAASSAASAGAEPSRPTTSVRGSHGCPARPSESTEHVPSWRSSVPVSPSMIPRKRLLCRPPRASRVAPILACVPQDVDVAGNDVGARSRSARIVSASSRAAAASRVSIYPAGGVETGAGRRHGIERCHGVRTVARSAGASTSAWRSASNPRSVPSTPTRTRAKTRSRRHSIPELWQ